MHNELTSSVKPLSCVTPAAGAAAATNLEGTIIDTLGFRSCCILIHFGPLVAGAVTSYRVQQGNAANMSDAADIAGSTKTVADDSDNLIRYADVHNVSKRYLRLMISRATENATVGSAVALLYKPSDSGFAQVAVGAIHPGPQDA
jgi:hypothetical protein